MTKKHSAQKSHLTSLLFLGVCTLLSLFVFISGTANIRSLENLIFLALFLPVPVYFLVHFIQAFRFRETLDVKISQKKGAIVVVFTFSLVLFYTSFRRIEQGLPVSSEATPTPVPMIINTKTATSSAETVTKIYVKSDNPKIEVNIRQEPSTTSQVVAKAKEGDTFVFLKESGRWYQVKVSEEISGWIHQNYAYKK